MILLRPRSPQSALVPGQVPGQQVEGGAHCTQGGIKDKKDDARRTVSGFPLQLLSPPLRLSVTLRSG
jgi:hypothetical protein